MEILCCRAHMGPAISEKFKQRLTFRLCLFWVKITSGNAFSEMRLFGWFGKFYFPEIEIRWPKKKSHWPRKSFYTSIFPSKYFWKILQRERKRAHARACTIRRSRSHRQTFQLPLIAISPSRDRTGSRSRSTARSREASIARSRM